jgi:hypothetical protein
MARNTRPRDLWSQEMVDRLYALTADRIGATKTAQMMSAEFGVQLTRNSILGRLFRDRQASKAVPAPAPRGGVQGARRAPAEPKPKKDNWRKDDERWLLGLTMRRRGHKWPFIAAHMKIPVAELKSRLRDIASADILEGGDVAAWSYVFEPPVDEQL